MSPYTFIKKFRDQENLDCFCVFNSNFPTSKILLRGLREQAQELFSVGFTMNKNVENEITFPEIQNQTEQCMLS